MTSGEHSVCRDIKELQRLYEGDEEECFDQGERFKYKIVYDGSGKRGYKVVKKMDLRTYTQKVFSMFGGEEKRVRIRFTNDLLDTVIERFGASDPTYTKFDDTHFTVSAAVEVSNMFYSWVCSFRKKAVILNPPEVVDGFQQFLSDIQGRYEQGQ